LVFKGGTTSYRKGPVEGGKGLELFSAKTRLLRILPHRSLRLHTGEVTPRTRPPKYHLNGVKNHLHDAQCCGFLGARGPKKRASKHFSFHQYFL